MRKSILLTLLAISTFFASAQKGAETKGNSYTINGKLSGLKEGERVYLFHKYNDKFIADSTTAKGDKFTFKGTTPETNMYWIQLNPKAKNMVIFFIDKGTITVDGKTDSLQVAKVKAGPTHDEYEVYNAMFKNVDKTKQQIVKTYNEAQAKGDIKTMEEQKAAFAQVDTDLENNIIKFIKSHPKSPVSGFAIFANFQNNPSIALIEELYNSLDPSLQNAKFGKVALERLDKIRGTTVGYKAVDFTQNDVNDKPVTLSSLRGKYILVDFWASWCGPCRAENPNVVAAYSAYKDKGFDILGVSLDQSKDKWLAAIQKDALPWTHVSDLKGWGNEVAQKYGIQSIPANLLLDKEGKILAKNLRGEDLKAKLEELLGK